MILAVKNLPANAGDLRGRGSIAGLGRSPGGEHGNPFQYSCLKVPWTEEPREQQVTMSGVTKSQTRLKWLSMHAPWWGPVGNLQARLGIHLRAGVWKLELRQHFYVELWKHTFLFWKSQSLLFRLFTNLIPRHISWTHPSLPNKVNSKIILHTSPSRNTTILQKAENALTLSSKEDAKSLDNVHSSPWHAETLMLS